MPCEPGTYNGMMGQSACQACPMGLAAEESGAELCKPCSTFVGQYANESSGRCTLCPTKPHNSMYTYTCNTTEGSLKDCACQYACDSTFVFAEYHDISGQPIRACGPLLDVVLLGQLGDGGRALILLLPLLCSALMLQALLRLISGPNFFAGLRAVVAQLPLDYYGRLPSGAAARGTMPSFIRWLWRRQRADGSEESGVAMEMLVSSLATHSQRGGEEDLAQPTPAEVGRSLLSGGAPHLESLDHAVIWNERRQLAKKHVHRVHLVGVNTPRRPWKLPALSEHDRRMFDELEFKSLKDEVEEAAGWQPWEQASHVLLQLCALPAAPLFANWRRGVHFERAKAVVASVQGDRAERFWRSLHTRVAEDYRMELTTDDLGQYAWLDVFVSDGDADRTLSVTAQRLEAARGAVPVVDAAAELPEEAAALRKNGDSAEALMQKRMLQLSGHASMRSRKVLPVPKEDAAHYVDFRSLLIYPAAAPSKDGRLASPKSPRLGSPTRLLLTSKDESEGEQTRGVRACLPLCGRCSYYSPAWVDATEFCAHSALWEALGSSSLAVMACINALLLRVDRASAGWRIALDEALWLLQELNGQLRAASVDAAATTRLARSTKRHAASARACSWRARATTADALRRGHTWGDGAAASSDTLQGDADGGEGGGHEDDGDGGGSLGGDEGRGEGDDGEAGGEERTSLPLLLGLVHQRALDENDDGAGKENQRQLALVVGYGDPGSWTLPGDQVLLRAGQVDDLAMGASFAPKVDSSSLTRWQRHQADALALARALVSYGCYPAHPFPLQAAGVLLMLQLFDITLTTFLYGTLCSAPISSGYCAATILIYPLAGLAAPLIGIVLTVHVMLLDRAVAWRPIRYLDPSLLARCSPSALVRSLRFVSLWNLMSMLSALVGFFATLALGDRLYTSRAPWLLPLAMLMNKLLISQALKLLASGVGYVRGAYSLLVGLLGERALDPFVALKREATQRRMSNLNCAAATAAGAPGNTPPSSSALAALRSARSDRPKLSARARTRPLLAESLMVSSAKEEDVSAATDETHAAEALPLQGAGAGRASLRKASQKEALLSACHMASDEGQQRFSAVSADL